ncbi:hypothetical protein L228DRAFT_242946 [Xylona heveae TC161]|uniref:Uncharacterized protein n=1 Tax=Xylona heveae (strain CBS 132557 / TC161) TaxID=1328760 RepID=A0A165JP13_XYLHT|nr:hypothetical protein L228DRAFT_242946 [Xylona heveae TC161]KZF26468.1 hypothetical protein L228DRAFT_242946 [Xylona heveae TC161]
MNGYVAFKTPSDAIGAGGHGANGNDLNALGRMDALLRLSGWVDLESRVSVCLLSLTLYTLENYIAGLLFKVGCAGAIISYLQRKNVTHHLPLGGVVDWSFNISVLEMFNFTNTL